MKITKKELKERILDYRLLGNIAFNDAHTERAQKIFKALRKALDAIEPDVAAAAPINTATYLRNYRIKLAVEEAYHILRNEV